MVPGIDCCSAAAACLGGTALQYAALLCPHHLTLILMLCIAHSSTEGRVLCRTLAVLAVGTCLADGGHVGSCGASGLLYPLCCCIGHHQSRSGHCIGVSVWRSMIRLAWTGAPACVKRWCQGAHDCGQSAVCSDCGAGWSGLSGTGMLCREGGGGASGFSGCSKRSCLVVRRVHCARVGHHTQGQHSPMVPQPG